MVRVPRIGTSELNCLPPAKLRMQKARKERDGLIAKWILHGLDWFEIRQLLEGGCDFVHMTAEREKKALSHAETPDESR